MSPSAPFLIRFLTALVITYSTSGATVKLW
jgi:hypothetical protein